MRRRSRQLGVGMIVLAVLGLWALFRDEDPADYCRDSPRTTIIAQAYCGRSDEGPRVRP